MPNNNPTGAGGFKKGQSGNPGGLKRKHIGDLSRETRRYAHLAVSTLVKICRRAWSATNWPPRANCSIAAMGDPCR